MYRIRGPVGVEKSAVIPLLGATWRVLLAPVLRISGGQKGGGVRAGLDLAFRSLVGKNLETAESDVVRGRDLLKRRCNKQ